MLRLHSLSPVSQCAGMARERRVAEGIENTARRYEKRAAEVGGPDRDRGLGRCQETGEVGERDGGACRVTR